MSPDKVKTSLFTHEIEGLFNLMKDLIDENP